MPRNLGAPIWLHCLLPAKSPRNVFEEAPKLINEEMGSGLEPTGDCQPYDSANKSDHERPQ
jgi:hypothetical protein